MQKYRGYTLVDITNTNITKYTDKLKFVRNQQRNWETVVQLVTLRARTFSITYFGRAESDLSKYSFGVDYAGKHAVWEFEFVLSNADSYFANNDRFGQLKQDVRITPILLDLEETVDIPTAFFQVDGPRKNIYFKSFA